MSKFRKRYYWKELSPEGLLKEPDSFLLNPFYGHDSEEMALVALQEYAEIKDPCLTEMVLITVYDNMED